MALFTLGAILVGFGAITATFLSSPQLFYTFGVIFLAGAIAAFPLALVPIVAFWLVTRQTGAKPVHAYVIGALSALGLAALFLPDDSLSSPAMLTLVILIPGLFSGAIFNKLLIRLMHRQSEITDACIPVAEANGQSEP